MKTKLSLLLILATFATFAQSLEKLKADTRKIYDANYNMDFDAVSALTYPKIVETLGGKTAFTDKLDSDYQNDECRMRLELVTPVFQFSEMKTESGKTCYLITYYNPTRYFFEKKMDAATAQKNAATLKENTNASAVTVEPKRNSINVKRTSYFIAVADESTNGEWRFINWDDLQQRKWFETNFPASVKKALGL